MGEKYQPRSGARVTDLYVRAGRAINRERAMTAEEREDFNCQLRLDIARVNKHSYNTLVGQAENFSKYRHKKYKG